MFSLFTERLASYLLPLSCPTKTSTSFCRLSWITGITMSSHCTAAYKPGAWGGEAARSCCRSLHIWPILSLQWDLTSFFPMQTWPGEPPGMPYMLTCVTQVFARHNRCPKRAASISCFALLCRLKDPFPYFARFPEADVLFSSSAMVRSLHPVLLDV